jgi:tRNA A-37 threonylcarbamoyl transferase component Bud32
LAPVDPFDGRVALNYQIIGKLGQGAFGSVYRARHLELGREVAIKILLPQHSAKPDLIERFMREAKVVCDIGHDDIVAVENAGRLDTGEPFYMMELVEGRSLARVVAEDGPFSPQRFARVFAPLASALAAAHDARVVHRDLKPQNVMVREKAGEILGVKLLDFGIAKFLHEADADSHTGDSLGTPHYMAPEQVQDAKHVDARADIYAFAGTAFFALSGQRPVSGATITEVLHNVIMREPTRLMLVAPQWGPALSETLARCMARDPAARPRGMREAWALISQAVSQRPPPSEIALGATMTAGSTGAGLTPTKPPLVEDPSSASMRTPTIAGSLPVGSATRPRWRLRTKLLAAVAALLVALGVGFVIVERDGGPGVTGARALAVPDAAVAPDAAVVAIAPDAAVPVAPDAAVVAVAADAAPLPAPVSTHHHDRDKTATDRRTSDKTATDRRTGATSGKNGVSKNGKPTTEPPGASATPAAPSKPAGAVPPPQCQKERFAQVYRMDAPTPDQVNEALRALIACHDAGYLSDDEYRHIQAALVSK